MDTRVLLVSLALSIVTRIVFGLIPAFRNTSGDLASTIKTSDQGPARESRSCAAGCPLATCWWWFSSRYRRCC